MDPLADVMDVSRVRGALLANVCARAPWGFEVPRTSGAVFHAVTSGTAWLRAEGEPTRQLMPGDVVLVPTAAPHRVSATPGARCRVFTRELKQRLTDANGCLQLDGPGAITTVVCASYDYDRDVAQPLLSMLPAVIHVPADPVNGRRIGALLSLLASELGGHEAGSRSAVDRLLDLLLIHTIRTWSATTTSSEPCWLRALNDPVVARVLSLIHARPAERWTIDGLAREVHLSRATLARRFNAHVGESPQAYLTRWRMDLAAQRLRDSTDSVETIARDVGYTSEYAFNRAFRRHRGLPPGRYRRAA
jgi:AraC-like DNA-binding protein